MIEGFKKVTDKVGEKFIKAREKIGIEPDYVIEGEEKERQEKYGDFTGTERLFGPEVWQGQRGEQIMQNYLKQFTMPGQQLGAALLGLTEGGSKGAMYALIALNLWKAGRPLVGMAWDNFKEKRKEKRRENFSGNDIGEITA